jgi:hypothetical protein
VRSFLPDDVGISVTCDHVTGVRLARGWSRVVKEQCRVACESIIGERTWKPAIGALRLVLETLNVSSGNASVVLSNRFVRYAIVPWQKQVSGADMEVGFARHCFRQIYGTASDRWEVRVSPGAFGHPRVASGVDQDLLDELRGAFAHTDLKIRSIQPYLMAAFNKWRSKLDNRACLFVVAEEQFYTCMVLVRGHCEAVHTGAFSGALNDSLPMILDREFMRSGLDERPPLFLYAGEEDEVQLGRAEPWIGIARHLREEGGIAASLESPYRSAVLAF